MLSMGWYRLLATELERKNNRGGWGGGGIGWGGGGSAGRGGDDLNAQEAAKWRWEEIEPHRVRERRRPKKKKKLLTAIENFETYRLIDLLHDIALHQSIYYPVSPAQ